MFFDGLFQWVNIGCDLLLLTKSGKITDFVNKRFLKKKRLQMTSLNYE